MLTSDSIREASSAVPKLWMWNPGTSTDVSHSMKALSTNRNSPSVTMVSGSVSTNRIGLSSVLAAASTIAAMIAAPHPLSSNPGSSFEIPSIAAAMTRK